MSTKVVCTRAHHVGMNRCIALYACKFMYSEKVNLLQGIRLMHNRDTRYLHTCKVLSSHAERSYMIFRSTVCLETCMYPNAALRYAYLKLKHDGPNKFNFWNTKTHQ